MRVAFTVLWLDLSSVLVTVEFVRLAVPDLTIQRGALIDHLNIELIVCSGNFLRGV